MDILTYALSKKYTEETIEGVGAIKGANCTIKSIVHQNNANIVTFEWKALDDTTRTSEMIVYDGTPIYAWTSGESYKVGDLVIYGTSFYQCIIANSDVTFNSNKWQAIGGSSADSNYGIVESSELLPTIFTIDDRKMFYVIDEAVFYLWNGTEWEIQRNTITAIYSNENLILS